MSNLTVNTVVIKWLKINGSLGNQNPVKLEINGVDILTNLNAHGQEVPGLPLLLPAFAYEGLMCLQFIVNRPHAVFMLDDYGEELIFIRREEKVLVFKNVVEVWAIANYDTLLSAWYTFARDVHLLLRSEDKALYSHEVWNCLNGQPLQKLEKYYVRLPWFMREEEFFSLEKYFTCCT